ncbi:RNA polymerase II transcription factor SIII subunit A-domain-containing protein [Mycena sp. CBHHK59/15]|nr:RNA polymerase II transcription factor SIII subunit A-domain-containing protein [Mycena sp. CBHHK59/15]
MALPDDRVPTLVQYCQRGMYFFCVSISSLGDGLRYDLVKPILERCTVDQLLRLEHASPVCTVEFREIWKDLCFRTYPTAAERYHLGHIQEPESWRDQYFVLVEEEARRLEEVGSRIRGQRLEAEERKREREVKLTDRIPPPKRSRGWGIPAQPKTLFQKTRSEASRLQKNMYAKPTFLPMPSTKNYRVLPPDDSLLLPASQSSVASSRVTVTTVVHRVSVSGSATVSASSSPSTLHATALSPRKKDRPAGPEFSPIASESRPPKLPIPMKRDPMAALFLPKHRAYSQRIN